VALAYDVSIARSVTLLPVVAVPTAPAGPGVVLHSLALHLPLRRLSVPECQSLPNHADAPPHYLDVPSTVHPRRVSVYGSIQAQPLLAEVHLVCLLLSTCPVPHPC
jgi:hypothetical protein